MSRSKFNSDAGLRYLGHGEWIPGIPARDLTAEEAARFAEVLRTHTRNTGRVLYGPAPDTPPAAASEAAAT